MAEKTMVKACAKINLGLDVTGRRADGYHEVRMIMQSVSLCDTLTLEMAEDGELSLETTLSALPAGPDNLVWRAIDLVRREFGIAEGVRAFLEKRIPVCAGLGGGSTDAAAAIRGMNELFSLDMSAARMAELGLRLGADVPFCITGGTCLAEGIGEKLTRLEALPQCSILIVKPPVMISTPVVYKELDKLPTYEHPSIDGMCDAIARGELAAVCAEMGNVLELVTAATCPEVGRIILRMKELGAVNAMMSGSGPSVFGIYDDEEKARAALEEFRRGPYADASFLAVPTESIGGIEL